MKKVIKVVILGFVLTFSQLTKASHEKNISGFVSDEISSMENILSHSPASSSALTDPENPEEGYFFRRFWLRVRPKAGVEVPGFTTFEVVPEIEMLFEKEVPEGWEIYRP